MRVSILGAPGSGKTTLSKQLAGLGFYYVSSGDLARANGFSGSKEESAGALFPDESKIRNLVAEATSGHDSYVLDGFPRMEGQAEDPRIPIDLAIYLRLKDPDIATQRLLRRGRIDDILQIINARHQVFTKTALPIVESFYADGKLETIDASGTIDETFAQAVLALARLRYAPR